VHKTNDYYGHTAILARYCGRPDGTQLFGYLQHGWNETVGFPADQFLLPGTPKYVWSMDIKRRADAAGLRNVTPIGAPFVYLAEHDAITAAGEGYTVAFPFHGWTEADVAGDHASYADELVEHESGDITVCLHINEYRVPRIRQAYESRGFTVTSNGEQMGQDFLRRQYGLLLAARRVVSNRMGTALWYAGFLRKEVAIYGQPMGVSSSIEGLQARERHLRQWPELYGVAGDTENAHRYANDQLGAALKRSPDELTALLGWGPQPLRHRAFIGLALMGSRVVAPARTRMRARRAARQADEPTANAVRGS
jgi:hypothetical protein